MDIRKLHHHFANAQIKVEYAQYCGTEFCVGVANGLEALQLILEAYIQLGKAKRGEVRSNGIRDGKHKHIIRCK